MTPVLILRGAGAVALIAWKGLEAGRFYIFTNEWAFGMARERLDDMESGTPRKITLRDVDD